MVWEAELGIDVVQAWRIRDGDAGTASVPVVLPTRATLRFGTSSLGSNAR
jgi:hypothetical protein